MDIIARLIELKPNSTERVEEWAKYLRDHRAQAVETLRNEGVQVESWFELTLEGKHYLLCYMRSDSMTKAEAVAAQSSSAVDAYHQQFKVDTWVRGRGAFARLLVDLTAQ